jgi:hypothetical protein
MDALSQRLMPGERLVWAGVPQTGIVFKESDTYVIPASLIWTAIALLSLVDDQMWRGGAINPFNLIILGVGLYATIGRFGLESWLRAGTHYGLTDRRVLILRSRPFKVFTSVALGRLGPIRISEGPNGDGTIWFGKAAGPITLVSLTQNGSPTTDEVPQFTAIRDSRKVFDLILRQSQLASR